MQLVRGDQAEGLRRLVATDSLRSLAWVGTRHSGKTTLMARFAQVLSLAGSDPLILLERDGNNSSLLIKNLYAGVVAGESRTILQSTRKAMGIRLGPLPTGHRTQSAPTATLRNWWSSNLLAIQNEVNVLLVEQTANEFEPDPLTVAAQELVLLLTPQKEVVTQTYAWMKRVARDYGREHFYVSINYAEPAQAECLFKQFQLTAKQYLGVRVTYAGSVPIDNCLVLSRYLVGDAATGYREIRNFAGPGWEALRRLAAESYGWFQRDEFDAGRGCVETFTERIMSVLQMRQLNVPHGVQ